MTDLTLEDSLVTSRRAYHSLRRLSQLKSLNLIRTNVADLAPIRHLATLEHLELDGSPITDKCLTTVAALIRLKSLGLARASVTDGPVKTCVRRLPLLESLDLKETKVSDAVISDLMALPRLRKLNLASTGVTEAGLAAISAHPALAELNVSGLRLSEAGLKRLLTMKNLGYLILSLPEENRAWLKAACETRPHLVCAIEP